MTSHDELGSHHVDWCAVILLSQALLSVKKTIGMSPNKCFIIISTVDCIIC